MIKRLMMILLWICVCWMSYEVHAIRKSVDENNLLIGVNQYCITVLQDAKLAEFKKVETGQPILTLTDPDILIDVPRISLEVKSIVLQFIRDQVHAMYEQGYRLDPNAVKEGRIEFIKKKHNNAIQIASSEKLKLFTIKEIEQ